jgi:cytoskeletal protein CcmA (bactofilin family)/Tfp pilus assembly protein PilF
MNVGKLNSYFGEGTVLKGTLRFKGLLRFDGDFEGEVISEDTFIVGEPGNVKANVDAGEFYNFGAVTGDVSARRKVSLHANSRLVGNIHTPILVAEERSFFEGACKMPPLPVDAKPSELPMESKTAKLSEPVMNLPMGESEGGGWGSKIAVGVVVLAVVGGLVWKMTGSGKNAARTTVAAPIAAPARPTGPTVDELTEAVENDPEDEAALAKLAEALVADGRYRDAIPRLESGVRTFPENGELALTQASTLQRVGKEAEALALYKEYGKTHAGSVEAMVNAAYDERDRGALEEAQKSFSKIVAANPEHVRARMGLATVYSKQEKNEEAVAACNAILAAVPDYAPALNRLAWLLAKQEANLQKAKELSERSLAVYDDIPEYIDTLSEVNYRMGDFDEAVRLIKKAVAMVPNDPYYKRQLFKFQRTRP